MDSLGPSYLCAGISLQPSHLVLSSRKLDTLTRTTVLDVGVTEKEYILDSYPFNYYLMGRGYELYR